MGSTARRPRALISFRLAAWLAVAAMLGLSLLSPAAAAARSNPPGNNGTVKVEGEELDKLHDNDPHVGCVFFIQWYGFDAGSRGATVTFDAQPPTGTAQLLASTFSFTGHGSGNALDEQRSYDLGAALAAFSPHPKQGFHVKLTVETDGSIGADKKHKVFWVQGCGQENPATPKPTPTPTDSVAPTASVSPTDGHMPSPSGGVAGATGTPQQTLPPTDTQADSIGGAAADGWRLVLMALAGLIAGALLLTPSPKRIRRD